jgi:cytochrome P450
MKVGRVVSTLEPKDREQPARESAIVGLLEHWPGSGEDRRRAEQALRERAAERDAISVEEAAEPLLERVGAEARLQLPPGPRSPAVAQAMSWLFRPVRFMERGRSRYGRVFMARLGPNQKVAFLSDPDLTEAVFTGESDLLRTGDINGVFRRIIGRDSILVLDGAEHLKRRRLLLPAFHGPNLEGFEGAMEEAVEREVATWPAGQPFAALPRIHAISTEIVTRAIFGMSDGARLDALREVLPRFLDLCRTPAVFIPPLRRELRGTTPWARLLRSIDELDEILLDQIRRRRGAADLDSRSDVLSKLVQAHDDEGGGLEDRQIRDELVTLLVAGHETTSGALAFAVEQIVQHPRVLDRVELAVRAGDERYLEAVIKESLRRRPVLPIAGRKLTARARLGEYVLPEGTVLMPCIYLLHHEPELYPHPDEFRPERFLEGPTGTYTWIPFGGGIRRCLGAAFATLEMKVVLRGVFGRLSVRAAGPPELPVRRSVSLAPDRGAEVIVEPLSGGFAA